MQIENDGRNDLSHLERRQRSRRIQLQRIVLDERVETDDFWARPGARRNHLHHSLDHVALQRDSCNHQARAITIRNDVRDDPVQEG